jgi:hypothetical protein
MPAIFDELKTQRWDDHRYYHHSRINQSLHLVSALSFVTSYALLFVNPAWAALLANSGWKCTGAGCGLPFWQRCFWLRQVLGPYSDFLQSRFDIGMCCRAVAGAALLLQGQGRGGSRG